MKSLNEIQVLFRSGTEQLYGIPYSMHSGNPQQHPRELLDAGTTQDWVWLGSPGWWGHMTYEEISRIQQFLKTVGDWVPNDPFSWIARETWEATDDKAGEDEGDK